MGGKQLGFSDYELTTAKKQTKREKFLSEMEVVVTWVKHRPFAQTARFLQLCPQVLHLAVVVVLPHRRLRLGPAQLPHQLEAFIAGVHWLSLAELGHETHLHPLLSLLTLPVRSEAEIQAATQQILGPRPDLLDTVLSILMERFPLPSPEKIMVIAGIPLVQLRHTPAAQEWMGEGEARGRAAEAAAAL